jgi:hypothetical protein
MLLTFFALWLLLSGLLGLLIGNAIHQGDRR